ncbi:hypothetical protein P8C59_005173 [Phyllachora maydis]|uniref:UBC core domain-containing protein n=1 Tax=Phyllachora maydis TaxID=1825666 RepID=A0AAD9ME78_9PEZI|nr:hypothetical protein P8C59_005173 [Phyllachora maydis]
MDGWMQFKFVQGSSDKELRFVQALHKVAAQQNITQNPTIFAWHGSRLGNWHSIVRTGLDFSDISPHYVVDQLDWHQCRYLFAQTRTDRAEPTKPDEGEGDDLDLLMPGIDADDDVETKPSQTAPVMEARPSQLLTPVHTGTAVTSFVPGALDLDSLPRLDPPAWATSAASKALSKELKTLQDVQSKFPASELGWYMDFEQTTNLFQWIVELHSFDLSHPLGADMKRAGTQSIVLEIRFGQNYPMDPPFVRVIRPRFLPFMNGGGGHVTAGGAMCMELLTSTGWRPVFSMESVFIQIRLALCSLDPRPARLEWTSCSERMDYGMGEALAAFVRAAGVHKWRIPQDVLELQRTRTM